MAFKMLADRLTNLNIMDLFYKQVEKVNNHQNRRGTGKRLKPPSVNHNRIYKIPFTFPIPSFQLCKAHKGFDFFRQDIPGPFIPA